MNLYLRNYYDVGWKAEKSGACSKKLGLSKLGAFMKNYLTARSASTVSIDSDPVVADVQVTPEQSPYPVPSDNDFKTSSFYLFSQKIRFSIQSHQL